jgi:hypothetical protein
VVEDLGMLLAVLGDTNEANALRQKYDPTA